MTGIAPLDPDNDNRDRLAEAVMAQAAFDGWSQSAITAAARSLALPEGEARRLFPGGTREIIDWIDARATDRMLSELKTRDLASMRIRQRVALAVRLRLEPLNAHREALRRAAAIMATPLNARKGAAAVWRTVDAIWHALGDTSTDYNYYTKRGLLAGVYGSTTLVWLNDRSPDCTDTWAFLDRRIENVMQFEKLKGQVAKLFDRGRMMTARP